MDVGETALLAGRDAARGLERGHALIFDPATSGGERWLGEGGLLVAGFCVAGALLVPMYYRRNIS